MSSPCRYLWAVAVGLALLGAAPTNSQATPILDQSQTIEGSGQLGCATDQPFAICSQSFTVGLTGTLTSVDVYLNLVIGTPEGGIYTDMSASGGTLAQTSPTVLAFGAPGFYSFVFNYPVVADDVLFFGMRVDVDEGFMSPIDQLDHYASGGLFVFVGANGFGTVPLDLAFRTYVDPDAAVPDAFRTYVDPDAAVPEPASLTLLGLGLAGIAGRRWRQRKAS